MAVAAMAFPTPQAAYPNSGWKVRSLNYSHCRRGLLFECSTKVNLYIMLEPHRLVAAALVAISSRTRRWIFMTILLWLVLGRKQTMRRKDSPNQA